MVTRVSRRPGRLRRASYTDGHGAMKSAVGPAANAVVVDTRNKPPAFEDQDTETDGDQSESTTRKVEENTEALATDNPVDDVTSDNVGSAVMADGPRPQRGPADLHPERRRC